MPPIVSRRKLENQLQQAFSTIGSTPVLIHSDLRRVGLIDRVKDRGSQLLDYEELLDRVLGTTCLLIPTFNFDFDENHPYDVAFTTCQVGSLGEHFRKRFPKDRTRTPVYNFVIRNNVEFDIMECRKPLGPTSTFGRFRDLGGKVVFLGAEFSSCTLLHHVEASLMLDYCFDISQEGTIIEDRFGTNFMIDTHLAPPLNQLLTYDWPRIEQDLLDNKILKQHPAGLGQLGIMGSAPLYDFWAEQLCKDPCYFLTEPSKKNVQQLWQKKGRPLLLEHLDA